MSQLLLLLLRRVRVLQGDKKTDVAVSSQHHSKSHSCLFQFFSDFIYSFNFLFINSFNLDIFSVKLSFATDFFLSLLCSNICVFNRKCFVLWFKLSFARQVME